MAEEQLVYTLSDNEEYYIVTGLTTYGANSETITIPETHENKNVEIIGANALRMATRLRVIQISSNIKEISNNAFNYCSNLTTVTFNNNSKLEIINEYAFSNCSKLIEIEIPNVKSINSFCFYNSGLKKITLPSSIQNIGSSVFINLSLDEFRFKGSIGDWCNVICVNEESNPIYSAKHFYIWKNNNYEEVINVLKIPNSVTAINKFSFVGLKNVSQVIIGENVEFIDTYAFYFSDIKEIILPPNKDMYEDVYNGNIQNFSQNSTYAINDIVKYQNRYYKCYKEITVAGHWTGDENWINILYIGLRAFMGCSNLETIYLSKSIRNISTQAFIGCPNLTNILYDGTETDWTNVKENFNLNSNTSLTNANLYFFSANPPTETDKYWHYNENSDYVIWTIVRKSNVYLNNENTIKDGYKVMIVPIKINTTYTIYIDSSIPIYIGSIYYDGVNVLTDEKDDGYELYDYISKTNCSFNQPFTYRVEEESTHTDKDGGDSYITILQNQLVMLIQIPEINTSTVLILEGDYTGDKLLNITEDDGTKIIEENGLKKVYYGKPLTQIQESELIDKYFSSVSSLTQVFDGQNYAFNDRLIEYLLLNVIDREEQIGENIQRIQEYLSSNKAEQQLNSRYKKSYIKGVWDLSLREYIYNLITQRYKRPIGKDINGFVDKDTEEIINQCKPNPKD